MKRITFLSALLLAAIVLAACAPAATPTTAPTQTESIPVTGDTSTPEVMATDTNQVEPTMTEAATQAATEAATASTTGITISTSTTTSVIQPFLVDNQGRTLYVFKNDTQNSGTSACTGDCATTWPPLIVTETPQAGEGVDSAMLGTITRDDGTMQASYNGWPLYNYSGDTAPGDVNGQGMNDAWFVVSTTGNAIQ